MKIDKGYTYSQLINKCRKLKSDRVDLQEFYKNVVNFDILCHSVLEEGMFVNPMEPFNASRHGLINGEYHLEWKAAEEKVIFKGWVAIDKDFLVLHEKNKDRVLSIYIDDVDFAIHETTGMICDVVTEIETVGDIFQATNGELEMQNLEI